MAKKSKTIVSISEAKAKKILKQLKQKKVKKAKQIVSKEKLEKEKLKQLSAFEAERQKIKDVQVEKEANVFDMLKFYREEYPELSLDKIKDIIYNETGIRVPRGLVMDSSKLEVNEERKNKLLEQKKEEERKRLEQERKRNDEEMKEAENRNKKLRIELQKDISKKKGEEILKKIREEQKLIERQRAIKEQYDKRIKQIEEHKIKLEEIQRNIPKYHHSMAVHGDKLAKYYKTRQDKIEELQKEVEILEKFADEKSKLEEKVAGYTGTPRKKTQDIKDAEKRILDLNKVIAKRSDIDKKKQQITELQDEIDNRKKLTEPFRQVEALESDIANVPIQPVLESDDDIKLRIQSLEDEARQIDEDMDKLDISQDNTEQFDDGNLDDTNYTDDHLFLADDGEEQQQEHEQEQGHGFNFTDLFIKDPLGRFMNDKLSDFVDTSKEKLDNLAGVLKRYMLNPKDIKLGEGGKMKFTKRGQKHINLLVRIHGPVKAGNLLGFSVLNAAAHKVKSKSKSK